MSKSESIAYLLNELADEYTTRLRRGETPTLNEYAQRYPHLAREIHELFPALQVIERHGSACDSAVRHANPVAVRGDLPTRLGEFRVLREIGRGGMGVVYEAIQESLGRHVALKVLPQQRSVLPSRLERFQREARAAAQLHHTNIVPVFAVGEADGLHFYAMQYIEGQPLDRLLHEVQQLRRPNEPSVGASMAADATEQGPRSESPAIDYRDDIAGDQPHSPVVRLTQPGVSYDRSVASIGLQAAEALSYAHEQGVLHRDIKPSNLLLDSFGTLWITDFGVARVVGTEELTVPGDVVGTLRYVPPERFQGQTGTPGDIYSLGLTLYELLALRPAFDAVERAELIHLILNAPVPNLRRVDPRIPRDLETIVLRAIARDPQRRYRSAEELAEDLRRFLSDRPILARRLSPWERTWRWCRRNPQIAALTSAVVLLSLVGVAILIVGSLRIRRERDAKDAALAQAISSLQTSRETYALAREAIDQYLNRVTSNRELESRDELHGLRRELLEQAIPFFEKLAVQGGNDDLAIGDRLDAYTRLGTLHRDLGHFAAALGEFRQAKQTLTSLNPAQAQTEQNRRALADIQVNLGAVLGDLGQTQESLAELLVAIQITEQLAGEFPDEAHYRTLLPKLQHNRSVLLMDLGQFEEALVACDACISLQSAIVNEAPTEGYYAWVLSNSYNRKGMLLSTLGKRELAREAFGQAAEIQRGLVAASPQLADPRDSLSMTLGNQADLFAQDGKLVEARALLQDAVTMEQEIVAQYASVARYRLNLAHQQIGLADVIRMMGDVTESLPLYEQAAISLEALVDPSQPAPQFVDALARAYVGQAVALGELGRHADAAQAWQRACEFGTGSELFEYRVHRVLALALAGESESAADEAQRLGDDPQLTGPAAHNLGRAMAIAAAESAPDRELVDHCASQAVAWFRLAFEKGWSDDEFLNTAPELVPLESRTDFQQLRAEVEALQGASGR